MYKFSQVYLDLGYRKLGNKGRVMKNCNTIINFQAFTSRNLITVLLWCSCATYMKHIYIKYFVTLVFKYFCPKSSDVVRRA